MAKLDFPSASASPFVAPNGVTYTYIGVEPNGHWSGTEADGAVSLEGKFVEVSGDDMSGDLTLGTNKIKLDATAGSADFAGGVQSPRLALRPTSDGDAYIQAINQGTGKIVANYFGNGNINLSSDLTSSTNITLNGSDGSASFAGYATFGNAALNAAKVYLLGSPAAAIQVEDTNGNQTVNISQNGGASFSGGATTISGTGAIGVRNYYNAVADNLFTCYAGRNYSGTTTSQIFSDGSATFAGRVDSVSGFKSTGDYGFNSFSDKTGPVITINNAAGNSPKCIINNDGSATFAGDVQVGGDPFPGTATGFKAYPDGSLVLSTTSSNGNIFYGYTTGNSTPTTVISGSGSATFAGTVSVNTGLAAEPGLKASGNTTGENYASVVGRQYTPGGFNFVGRSGLGTTTFSVTESGSVTSASTFTFLLEADDDTKYTSTTDVDEEGNETVTRVYNGTTLDVKDRLTKADTALQSLKTAVANATDFNALKTAMIAALADI